MFEHLPVRFLHPRKDIRMHGGKLPHWQQGEVTQFLTFRLADAIPQKQLHDWERERDAWLGVNPKPWSDEVEVEYNRRFLMKMEEWFDSGMGECLLKQPAFARIVSDALHFFDGQRYELLCYVIMPNHVHVLVTPGVDIILEDILHSWKRHSSREIHKALGREGNLWQAGYFDRMIRDEVHLGRAWRYILKNPGKARLSPGQYFLWQHPGKE